MSEEHTLYTATRLLNFARTPITEVTDDDLLFGIAYLMTAIAHEQEEHADPDDETHLAAVAYLCSAFHDCIVEQFRRRPGMRQEGWRDLMQRIAERNGARLT